MAEQKILPPEAGAMKRVVITGAGTINALGHDVPETLAAMREGRCGIGPLEFAMSSGCRSASAGRSRGTTRRPSSTASRSRCTTGSRSSR